MPAKQWLFLIEHFNIKVNFHLMAVNPFIKFYLILLHIKLNHFIIHFALPIVRMCKYAQILRRHVELNFCSCLCVHTQRKINKWKIYQVFISFIADFGTFFLMCGNFQWRFFGTFCKFSVNFPLSQIQQISGLLIILRTN